MKFKTDVEISDFSVLIRFKKGTTTTSMLQRVNFAIRVNCNEVYRDVCRDEIKK